MNGTTAETILAKATLTGGTDVEVLRAAWRKWSAPDDVDQSVIAEIDAEFDDILDEMKRDIRGWATGIVIGSGSYLRQGDTDAIDDLSEAYREYVADLTDDTASAADAFIRIINGIRAGFIYDVIDEIGEAKNRAVRETVSRLSGAERQRP